MPHARETIRDAVITAVTGLATTGASVSGSRVYAFGALPFLNVTTLNDEVVEVTTEGDVTRDLTVVVEARVKLAADVDDQIDDISAEIEAAIHADRTLGGVVKDIMIQNTEIEINGEEEQLIGIVRMEFLTQYRVALTDPTTIIL